MTTQRLNRHGLSRLTCLLVALYVGPSLGAALVTYDDSPWNPAWETPGLYTSVGAVDVRQGVVDDPQGNGTINEIDQDSEIVLNDPSVVSVWAKPAGSTGIPGVDPYSARAKTEFGRNQGAVQTTRHYDFDSESGEFYVTHESQAEASSSWADTWSFTDNSLVTLDLHWDATFDVDPICPTGTCSVDPPPGTDISTLQSWWYLYRATLGIYDLDNLVPYFEEDSDVEYLFPALVTSIFIEQRGFGRPEDTLDALNANGSLSFTPTIGHRYAVGSQLFVSGARGGDIDAFNTLALDRVILAPGQELTSQAVANLGAQYRIDVATVPAPAAAWLLLTAIGSLGLRRFGRRTRG